MNNIIELPAGVKLNKTEIAFVNKLIVNIEEGEQFVRNPFGGGAVIPPVAQAIYDWIIGWSLQYERNFRCPMGSSIKEFDMARGLFRKVWPRQYMELLD